MTKQEAVENHRELWNGIADMSEEENRCIKKEEYFKKKNIEFISCYCYCCEYDSQFEYDECSNCPISWDKDYSEEVDTPQCMLSEYKELKYALKENNVTEFVRLSRIIANLPEREDVI